MTKKGCYQGDKCAFKHEKNDKRVRFGETNTDDLEIKSLKAKVEENNKTIENQSIITQILEEKLRNHEEDKDKIDALEESLKQEKKNNEKLVHDVKHQSESQNKQKSELDSLEDILEEVMKELREKVSWKTWLMTLLERITPIKSK